MSKHNSYFLVIETDSARELIRFGPKPNPIHSQKGVNNFANLQSQFLRIKEGDCKNHKCLLLGSYTSPSAKKKKLSVFFV